MGEDGLTVRPDVCNQHCLLLLFEATKYLNVCHILKKKFIVSLFIYFVETVINPVFFSSHNAHLTTVQFFCTVTNLLFKTQLFKWIFFPTRNWTASDVSLTTTTRLFQTNLLSSCMIETVDSMNPASVYFAVY